jgi:hypothetical protein
MRKLILMATILAMFGVSPVFARAGHEHSRDSLSSPANPAVPPSLTPHARLTGSAPLPSHNHLTEADTSPPTQFDPEDAKVNKMIKNICRGC